MYAIFNILYLLFGVWYSLLAAARFVKLVDAGCIYRLSNVHHSSSDKEAEISPLQGYKTCQVKIKDH